MKYFTAIYSMPAQGLQDWMAKPPEERKMLEEGLKQQWDAWMAANAGAVKNTVGLGSTKRITSAGIEDTHNGLMMSSYVEAESAEAAAEIFKNHPHLQIPGAVIEVMEAKEIS